MAGGVAASSDIPIVAGRKALLRIFYTTDANYDGDTVLARLTIGNDQSQKPYSASLLNVSAMSYEAISPHAIEAMNEGARRGGFYHDTGEGGVRAFVVVLFAARLAVSVKVLVLSVLVVAPARRRGSLRIYTFLSVFFSETTTPNRC